MPDLVQPATPRLRCAPRKRAGFPASQPVQPLGAATPSTSSTCSRLPFERLRLPVPTGRKHRPRILGCARTKIRTYISDPELIGEIDRLLNALNPCKRKRLERRVSIVALTDVLLDCLDLVSMRVGIPLPRDCFRNFDLDYLAGRAGLTPASLEGAWTDLKAVGFVKSRSQCREVEPGHGNGHRGVASIKYVSVRLFELLGLGPWLAEERRKAVDRKAKRDAARVRRTSPDHPRHRDHRPHPGSADQPGGSDWRERTAVILLAGQLRIDHPGWDRETCLQAARQQVAQQSGGANPCP